MDDIDNGPDVFKRTFVSLASGVVHVTVAVVVAGVLEGLFPPYRAPRDELDIWIDLGVGTLEILTYVLLIGAVEMGLARWFSGMDYADLPYGGLLMFWLLQKALMRVSAFVSYIGDRIMGRPTITTSQPTTTTGSS